MTFKGAIPYVEDNPDNRNLVRRVLEAEGYSVIEAKDAAQALGRLQTVPTNLILMDIKHARYGRVCPDGQDQVHP